MAAGRLFPPTRAPAEGEVDLRAPISAFGRYDLLEKIGEGHASEVFVARSDGFEGLFRLSALKRMKAQLCSDTVLVSRFIEEARLAVRVEQEGTVTVDDFGRVGGVYFIAFELVDGISVDELIWKTAARGIAIDPRAAAYVARAVAKALDAIHRTKGADGKPLGLVHGDLEPKNVLIARSGKVKVRGFAAPSIFASPDQLKDALGVAGLAHQAPEVLLGEPPSVRSDVWSAGALLFEMLTGGPLFPSTRIDDVVAAVRAIPIAPPSARRPGLSSVLDAIVDEALVRNVNERAKDPAAWAAQLDDYLAGAGYDEAAFAATLADLDDDDARGSANNAYGRQPTRVTRRPSTNPATPIALGASRNVAPLDSSSNASTNANTNAKAVGTPFARQAVPAAIELPAQPALIEQLRKDPGPWGLVRFAERTHNDGRVDEARAMFRSAAVLFASRGLLAHALCAYDGARASLSADDIAFDLKKLSELGAGDMALRQQELRRVGGLAYLEALRAQTDGVESPGSSPFMRGATVATPFLSALPPDAFARLGSLSRVRRVPAGAHVLREGEPGDSLFAIGEGRLVVTCTPSGIDPTDGAVAIDEEPDEFDERTDPGLGVKRVSGVVVAPGLESELGRQLGDEDPTGEEGIGARGTVFLSALTAGDLFGEFSFLTGRPRSASVEAVTSCRLVEITKRAVGGLLDEHLELRDALEAFYKERVLEWMLAKNEVFSLLEPESRRALLAQCGVYDIPAGKMVVREGELHDAMYFIKRGEVEVFTDDDGVDVFINKLGPGEFFGEIAALEGGPRRASVRAVTDLEVFRITRRDLAHVLADAPDVKEKLERAMRARSDEIRRRIQEQRQVLAST